MKNIRVGFLGFGEVASVFSKTMLERGGEVKIYDILLEREGGRSILEQRAKARGLVFTSLGELMDSSDYILSTVTTQAALPVAKGITGYLKPGRFYIDLNSTAPSVKVEIGRIIRETGACFCEGAILGAVGATKDKTKILIGGNQGCHVAGVLSCLGLNAHFYSDQIGKASMFKMLRSIFSKGLEALLLELLMAGHKAGIDRDLWSDVMELMKEPFDKVASNWMITHCTAHERRYHEILQVMDTMRELGLEPVMTSGTGEFFKRSVQLGLERLFDGKPDHYEEVVSKMLEQLERRNLHLNGGNRE